MNSVLIIGERDASGAVQNLTLELLALAQARKIPADVVMPDGDRPGLLQTLSAHGANRVWFLTGDVARYSARKQASAITAICQKIGVDSLWGSSSLRSRDLLSYCAGLAGGDVIGAVRGLEAGPEGWVVASEAYAGRVVRRDRPSSRFTSLAFASTGVAAVAREGAAAVPAETFDVNGSDVRFVGDLVVPEREAGVQLKDADVVLDIGAGVGAKGVIEAKKLLSVLLATGARASIGGTRVVTDAALLPRGAQIGVSGIPVTARLVVAVGVSGAPQHWVGIKDCGSIVAVNTDAEAPLMRMADVPIQGDGLAFLKELGAVMTAGLTETQKAALKQAAETRRARPAAAAGAGAPTSAEPIEPLSDAPLKVDVRSLEFDAFHVYKVDRLDPAWTREKLAPLLRKVATYAEASLNRGKRTAEQIHCRFVPGEEHEQQAVVTPPGLKQAFQEYYQSGFGRFSVPRRFGGLELPHGFLDLVSEIVNAGSVAMGTSFELTQGASLILQNFGNEWMKDVLIPGLYDGRFQGTMCLTEPQAGSDLGAVATTAERIEGSELFTISGTKIFITAGDHDMAENFVHIVLAKIKNISQRGTRAISLFVVPKFWIDEEGRSGEFNRVYTQSIEHKHGMTTSPTAVLKFDGARGLLIAPDLEDEILQPSGMKAMFFMMNYMRHETGTAARAQAMATCLDTLIYNTERTQGQAVIDRGRRKGPSPIFHHASQKKILLDMFARTLAGRGLTQRLTEIRDASDRALEHELEAVAKAMEALGLSAEQRRRIAELEKSLAAVDRRLGKAELGRLTFRKEPEAVAALEREEGTLKRQRDGLRAALGAVSPAYRDLQDRAARARRDKADEETYASIYTSLVKAQVTDDNIRTLNEGMNAYGGIGFMAETPVSQRLRDSQVLCIWEGTNDIQALNTVGRQIAPDNTDSRGRVVFERLFADIRQFIGAHRGHPAFAESLTRLDESVDALQRFRNAMTRATRADQRAYRRRMHGSIFARPDAAAEQAAEGRWAEMVQASARNFSTYLAQVVQAWQLLRMGLAAHGLLQQRKAGVEPPAEDRQFDEAFLRGRVLLANHFVASPNCLDRGLLHWERQFYHSVPWELAREELCDAVERITVS
jgi:alkylation response protein AidB-like acyl-CoA dehydrogenase/electron transfer flavoprotein alpha subunit